ncbi:MAG: hypothetical protein AB7K24_04005 [Gemmataceae bacterium]
MALVGIDLDHCRDCDSGKIEPWAQAIIDQAGSYTEISPSGTGVRIITTGTKPGGRCRTGHVEMYAKGRYLTFTGHHVKGTPKRLLRRTKAIAKLHADLFPPPTPTPSFGLDDDEVIDKAQAAANGNKFARLWAGDTSDHAGDESAGDLALCAKLAFWCRGNREQIARLFARSGLMREKWERQDYRERTIDAALAGRTEFYTPPSRNGDLDQLGLGKSSKGKDEESQATKLVKLVLASGSDLWHCPKGTAYITLPADDHFANWSLRSRSFRTWLNRRYFRKYKRAASAQAIIDAVGVLEGHAVFDGIEQPVYVRAAQLGGTLYLDLADAEWRAVEIDSTGWRVVQSPPVRFRRASAMLPLPFPTPGNAADLRRFLNISDGDWPLVAAWLVAAMRPTGPFPVLCLFGEQGSAKSTAARVLRSLIDPNAAPIRAEPREQRDLAIAANNGWVVALDNLSHLSPWLSDALCRLSTGGGFATRTLHTDEDETIFDAQRPVIVTGIDEVTTRGDLLDRALLVQLPRIDDAARKTESAFWSAFESARPAILGGFLDGVVSGLQRLDSVNLKRPPRMADFAAWAVACRHGLGLPAKSFLTAYRQNREAANQVALESAPLTGLLISHLAIEGEFSGTVGNLLTALEITASDNDQRQRWWPRTPRRLAGDLRRLAPNLRQAGIAVEFSGRTKSGYLVTLNVHPRSPDVHHGNPENHRPGERGERGERCPQLFHVCPGGRSTRDDAG